MDYDYFLEKYKTMIISINLNGCQHILEVENSILQLEQYSEEAKILLQNLYDSENFEEVETVEIKEYKPVDFRVDLMLNPGFQQWQVTIPDTVREDLKISAGLENWEVLQMIYNRLPEYLKPIESVKSQWQAIADEYNVPLIF